MRIKEIRKINKFAILFAICASVFAACYGDETVRNGLLLAPVAAVELSVDEAKFTGNCPHKFKFSGVVSASGAGTVGYRFHDLNDDPWEPSTIATGSLQFTSAAAQTLSLELLLPDTGIRVVVLDITGANSVSSNSLRVTATCR